MTSDQEQNIKELREIIERLAKLGVSTDMSRPITTETTEEEDNE